MPNATKDAIALLKADHAAVSGLFAEYRMTHSATDKKALVAEICTVLSVHAQIEEEIFYPAVTAALKHPLPAPEATVEHARLRGLIGQLEGVEPDGKPYDAKVKVLADVVRHHIREEQNGTFPKLRAAALDMSELGARMAVRRAKLLAHRA